MGGGGGEGAERNLVCMCSLSSSFVLWLLQLMLNHAGFPLTSRLYAVYHPVSSYA